MREPGSVRCCRLLASRQAPGLVRMRCRRPAPPGSLPRPGRQRRAPEGRGVTAEPRLVPPGRRSPSTSHGGHLPAGQREPNPSRAGGMAPPALPRGPLGQRWPPEGDPQSRARAGGRGSARRSEAAAPREGEPASRRRERRGRPPPGPAAGALAEPSRWWPCRPRAGAAGKLGAAAFLKGDKRVEKDDAGLCRDAEKSPEPVIKSTLRLHGTAASCYQLLPPAHGRICAALYLI